MNNENYRNFLKEKKIELIGSLNSLGNVVINKIKEKNVFIDTMKKEINTTNFDKIKEYKEKKNKEFNSLKTELDEMLKNIDEIITNITE